MTPLPIKVFSMKWRSKGYENLLHKLDQEAEGKESNPLLRGGPAPHRHRSARSTRLRVAEADPTRKIVPITCPKGRPSQFYDATFLRNASQAGLTPHLRIGTAYPHALPQD